MKKRRLNNKGFVLVETLVVSVFVMSIFAILYNNFYPLIGEYEKRENYDDIDGKYNAYWIKRIIQHESVTFSTAQLTELNNNGYFKFNCGMVGNSNIKQMCYQLIAKAQVKNEGGANPNIYITKYNLAEFKTKVDNSSSFSGGMHKYVEYLPNYKWDSLNNAKYRVIVEFHRVKDGNDYLAYSTIEVKK